ILEGEVAGLDWVGRLLGARGRVLPMAAVPLEIEADVRLGPGGLLHTVRGQSRVPVTSGTIEHIRLMPDGPPACPEAISAVDVADWVVLGPSSCYTAVLRRLLVPEDAAALQRRPARRALTLNLSDQQGETSGMGAADLLRTLHEN